MDHRLPYISLDDCKDGYLYEIQARNFSIGIFNSYDRSFVGIRYKFGTRFLDTEVHWDADDNHGTVKPIRELELSGFCLDCPFRDIMYKQDMSGKTDIYDKIFDHLDKRIKEYEERE